MFEKQIKALAPEAIEFAENQIGAGRGVEKKELAINYILKLLPLPNFLNPILAKLLANLLDNAIELALRKAKAHTKLIK